MSFVVDLTKIVADEQKATLPPMSSSCNLKIGDQVEYLGQDRSARFGKITKFKGDKIKGDRYKVLFTDGSKHHFQAADLKKVQHATGAKQQQATDEIRRMIYEERLKVAAAGGVARGLSAELRKIALFIARWKLEATKTKLLLARLTPERRGYVMATFTASGGTATTPQLEQYIGTCEADNFVKARLEIEKKRRKNRMRRRRKPDEERQPLKYHRRLQSKLEEEIKKRKRLEADLSESERLRVELESQQEIQWEDARIEMETAQKRHKMQLDRMQDDIEHWKRLPLSAMQLPPTSRVPRPQLVNVVQSLLLDLLPPDHSNMHNCKLALKVQVQQVYEIQNCSAWKNFCSKKQEITARIQGRSDCPSAAAILPNCTTLKRHLKHIILDTDECNEVLLLHGTKDDSISGIIDQGFDARLSKYTLFGAGTYFTTESCKAVKYSNLQFANHAQACSGHFFIARVLLGHPYLATGPMKSHRRPPMADRYSMPHDSVVAQPGIYNGQPGGQVHYEVVLPDGQAYPELLVQFNYVP